MVDVDLRRVRHPDYVQVSYPNRSGVQSFGPTAGFGPRVRHPSERQRLSREQLHPPPGPGVFEPTRCSVLSPRAGEPVGMVMAVRAGVARFLGGCAENQAMVSASPWSKDIFGAQPSSRFARPMSGRLRVDRQWAGAYQFPAAFPTIRLTRSASSKMVSVCRVTEVAWFAQVTR